LRGGFSTFSPSGIVSPKFGTTPDDIRGLALVGPNSCEVDLAVSLSIVAPEPAHTGAIAIHAQVVNTGPARALGPSVTITLPPSVTIATTTGCAEDPAGIPICTVPTLFLGDTATIAIAGIYDGTLGPPVTMHVATASHDTLAANDNATFGINDTIFVSGFECGAGCLR
jgi:hypothetical protein